MAMVPYGMDPAVIQAARAAMLARAGGGIVPNANVPPPVMPSVRAPIDDSGQVVQRDGKGAMIDDSGQTVNTPGKAALGQMPQSIQPPQFDEAADDGAYAEDAPDPRTTPKGMSLFNNPGATDALAAFGAAMLKAPNFNQGLGDAALAVNAVERENRMPSEQEIARAQLKRRLAASQNPARKQTGDPIYDQQGNMFIPVFDPDTGETEYQPAPEGMRRATDSGMKEDNKEDVKFKAADMTAEAQSHTNVENYKHMRGLIDTAGVGTDVGTKTMRGIAQALGIDVGNVDLSDQQEFQKYARTIELAMAQTQRGLGQFTEMERKIVLEALPNINTNPDAAKKVLDVMIARDERLQQLVDDWYATGEEGSYRAFRRRWMRAYEEAHPKGIFDEDTSAPAGDGKAPAGVDPSVSKYYTK